MKPVQLKSAACCLFALSLAGCGGAPPSNAAPSETAPGAAPAASGGASTDAAPASSASKTVTLPTGYPERPFVRVEFDKLAWRATEGNKLGVETAVVEGDPSKPGYYLTTRSVSSMWSSTLFCAVLKPTVRL